MAVVHGGATLAPTKPELVASWLTAQPWAEGLGDLEQIGSYRFDDPDGEVGVEALVLRAGDRVLHLPVTYRASALEGAETHLIGTTAHSALGTRWVYDGCADPVAVRAFLTAALAGGTHADLDVERDARIVERRTATVTVRGSGSDASAPGVDEVTVRDLGAVAVVSYAGHELAVARLLPADVTGRVTLTATWHGGEAVVAAVS